jgi:hypothetical protein
MKRRLWWLAFSFCLTACQESLNRLPVPNCGAGTTQCGKSCVSTLLDDAHCGNCGTACAAQESCAGGTCFPKTCADTPCTAAQVCVAQACVEKTCAGIVCGAAQVCVSGSCQDEACASTGCPLGSACLGGVCTDVACQGITCAAGLFCARGICSAPSAGLTATFASGSSFGGEVQSNATHKHFGILGEALPAGEVVLQNNSSHQNHGGFISQLRNP